MVRAGMKKQGEKKENKGLKYKHNWTKDDLRILFMICKLQHDDKVCKHELATLFPKCSLGALHIAVCIRYAELNGTNRSWFASNVPKKWREVWNENNYYRDV
jgi:hypothetical protein